MLSAEENELLTRTGPGTPMGDVFRRFWLPALLSSELPAPDCPPVRVRFLSENLVAFRDSEGKVGLVDAHCPHRRADLFFGRNEESGLRCVYHGWKFDVSGACVDMPNEPAESNFKGKITTTAYPCQERGGVIWTYMGPQSHTPEMSHLEWALVPDSHRVVGKVQVNANYFQTMEGEMDNSHVAFLHSMLTGGSQSNALAAFRNTTSNAQGRYSQRDKTPRGIPRETDYGIQMAWRRNADDEHYHWHINQWLMPCQTMVGSQPNVMTMSVLRPPRDDESTWAFVVHWNGERSLSDQEREYIRNGANHYVQLIPGTFLPAHNKENDYKIDRSLQKSYSFSGIPTPIYNQDFAMTVNMGVIVDRTKEHLGTSDAVTIAVRRILMKTATDLQQGIEPSGARHPEAYFVRPVDVLLAREVPFEEGAVELMKARYGEPAPEVEQPREAGVDIVVS